MTEKVEKAYARAIEVAPDELQAHANMATFYLNANRFDEAVALWELLIDRAPKAGV